MFLAVWMQMKTIDICKTEYIRWAKLETVYDNEDVYGVYRKHGGEWIEIAKGDFYATHDLYRLVVNRFRYG